MKILVTGITGFIGQNLIPFLAPEDEVWCLVRGRKIMTHNYSVNLRYINGDLREPRELFRQLEVIKPEICVHLAWQDIPDFSFGTSIENLYQGTRLFQFLVEKCGCKKIISIGSCFEYSNKFGMRNENDDTEASSYFTWAKNSLKDFGFLLAKNNNITFIWSRLFYVYGEGQRKESLIPTIVHQLRHERREGGRPFILKTPHNENDFIHVKDVARAIALMTEKEDLPTGIYNVGTSTGKSVWELVRIVEDALGIDHEASEFFRASETGKTADFWAGARNMHEFLGWHPKISIEEGIRDYIKNTA